MPHYRRICGRARPNEKFSGNGRRTHVGKDCMRIPKTERRAIEQEEEIFGYLKQSHISEKNIGRLRALTASDNPRIAELATIVLAVGKVHPYKKKRLKALTLE